LTEGNRPTGGFEAANVFSPALLLEMNSRGFSFFTYFPITFTGATLYFLFKQDQKKAKKRAYEEAGQNLISGHTSRS